jgi:hypothetical protein
MSEFKCPKCGAALTVEPKTVKTSMTLEQVKNLFPVELQDILTFNKQENSIIIKPRQYLGSNDFAKVASTIRGAGGQYVSAGKNSHFKIETK